MTYSWGASGRIWMTAAVIGVSLPDHGHLGSGLQLRTFDRRRAAEHGLVGQRHGDLALGGGQLQRVALQTLDRAIGAAPSCHLPSGPARISERDEPAVGPA
jgi:hypothetical protein